MQGPHALLDAANDRTTFRETRSTLSGNASFLVTVTVRNSSLTGFPNAALLDDSTGVFIASTLSAPIAFNGTAPVCTGIIRAGVAVAGC